MTTFWKAFLGVLLAGVVGGGCVVGACLFGGGGRTATSPATLATPAPGSGPVVRATTVPRKAAKGRDQDVLRVLLENSKWDDSTRALMFQRLIEKAGQRCDEVTLATMRGAGNWTVRCPGYTYGLRFNAKGEVTSFVMF